VDEKHSFIYSQKWLLSSTILGTLVSGLKRRMKKDISTEKVAASFFGLFGMKVGMKNVSIRFLRPLRNSFMTESRDEIKLGLCLAKDFKEILCYFGGFLSRQSQR
jgi:hypothetical protein